MKRILVDLERVRYRPSGLAYYCQCLERGLMEITEEDPIRESLSFYGPAGSSKHHLRRYRQWHDILNPMTFGVNILHTTHQQQHYLQRGPQPKYHVVTLHDLNFLIERSDGLTKTRELARAQMNLNRADVIICISNFVRQMLWDNLALFRLKPNVRIEVIYNGILLDEQAGLRPPTLAFEAGTPYLLSVGVITYKKQQLRLIEMLPHLAEPLHLVLVHAQADRAYTQEITSAIKSLGLQGRVHFLRNISTAEKSYLLRHCTAYLHPSIAEGFGIPPIEAMNYGRPVFLSKHTSLPEIGGEEAYYFDSLEPEDMARSYERGMKDFVSNPTKSEHLKAWAKRYDYRVMARQYLEVYRSLMY